MRRLIISILSVGIIVSVGNVAYASEETKEPVTQQAPLNQEENNLDAAESVEVINTMMKANDEANVRSGPDREYRSLGKLEIGQDVFVLERLPSGWYQISYKNGNAYVACEYLTVPMADEALAKEMQASLSENLAQISEADTEIGQLKEELAAARETASQAQKAAEKAMAELVAEREKKKAGHNVNIALIIAGMFSAVFIGGLVMVLKPENKTAVKESDESDDGLELISLNSDKAGKAEQSGEKEDIAESE